MPKDLEVLLRTTYLGTMMMMVSNIRLSTCRNRTGIHLFSVFVLSYQNPALMDQPLSLQIEVTSPPRSTIKTSGASVAVTSMVKVLVLPAGKPPVQLSSMTMVRTIIYTMQ